ncbi:MAG: hypothetical protein L6R41_006710 [Letrouitia leprolyta]|nr:MAG: hypothetical protein L6R41_006710 [Letrouitia leprolyta]
MSLRRLRSRKKRGRADASAGQRETEVSSIPGATNDEDDEDDEDAEGRYSTLPSFHFIHGNTRLLTGDAEGWVVSWNLTFKRPVAVWQAHTNAILGIGSWGDDRVITHGRDSKFAIWQLGPEDEELIEKTLPINKPPITTPQPWLLHMLTVNTLNFCSFSMCPDGLPLPYTSHVAVKAKNHSTPILIAVPNTTDSAGIDIYQLPSESRAAVIHADRNITTGMVMALAIQAESTKLQVAAGYESGHTMVFVQSDPGAQFQRLYSAQPHSQPGLTKSHKLQSHTDWRPVLSIAILPSRDCYVTSAADAIVAKHPLPAAPGIWKTELKPFKVVQTKHSGQQGLHIRSDGRIFATAGWDARIRVYSAKTLKEVAVLKWHSLGCYATAFAEILNDITIKSEDDDVVKQEEDEDKIQLDRSMVHHSSPITTVQQRRDAKAHSTHWLAAGSKDGKVSLWEMF